MIAISAYVPTDASIDTQEDGFYDDLATRVRMMKI